MIFALDTSRAQLSRLTGRGISSQTVVVLVKATGENRLRECVERIWLPSFQVDSTQYDDSLAQGIKREQGRISCFEHPTSDRLVVR
jgi:hypothetical protein